MNDSFGLGASWTPSHGVRGCCDPDFVSRSCRGRHFGPPTSHEEFALSLYSELARRTVKMRAIIIQRAARTSVC